VAGKDDDDREPESSGEIDITGWGRVDDASRRKRKRITLDVMGPPLALPNMPAKRAVTPVEPTEGPPSTEMMLPELTDDVLAAMTRASSPGSSETPLGEEDAWSRAREQPEAMAPKTRSVTPPPFSALPKGSPPPPNEAIALVATRSRPPGSSVLDLAGEMLDRYALGDFSGALLAAEIVLGKEPGHVEARKCAQSCRERLSHLHLSRLGGGDRVPRVAVQGSEVRWLGLDHRAGFLLSRIDGNSTIEELVDLSGMPRHEALKLLVELLEAGALQLDRHSRG
jgi:hypothetical protein